MLGRLGILGLVIVVLELVFALVVDLRLEPLGLPRLVDRLVRRQVGAQRIPAHDRAKSFPLLASNFDRVGTGPSFELQMLADRFVEQSHHATA